MDKTNHKASRAERQTKEIHLMKRKQLCELFNESNTKDGFQMAMHKLGLRLSSRDWKIGKRELLYMGFQFSKNRVSFCWLTAIEKGVCGCETFRIGIEEAIDCASGNLDKLIK